MASLALPVPQVPVAPASLMNSSAGANSAADATTSNHKGVNHHFHAVRAHSLRPALFGHRLPGHKNHNVMTG
jgi:hypothetical protein